MKAYNLHLRLTQLDSPVSRFIEVRARYVPERKLFMIWGNNQRGELYVIPEFVMAVAAKTVQTLHLFDPVGVICADYFIVDSKEVEVPYESLLYEWNLWVDPV